MLFRREQLQYHIMAMVEVIRVVQPLERSIGINMEMWSQVST